MASKPLSVSVPFSLEKSKLGSGDPFLALLKITWPNEAGVLRLARNTADIQFDCGDGSGVQTYTAFHWEFSPLKETSDGSLPNWGIGVSNVRRMVEAMVEQYGGGVGGEVSVYIVQASRLKREPDLEYDFDITSGSSNAKLVNFQLGAESPFRIMLGRHLYSSDSCVWRYKGPQCQYAGTLPSCSRTMNGVNGCRAHNNVVHFGAQPGLDSNGFRTVQK